MDRKVVGLTMSLLAVAAGCATIKDRIKTEAGGAGSQVVGELPAAPTVGSGSSGSSGSGGGDSGMPGWKLDAKRVLVVEPDPGRPRAPAMAPTWCATQDKLAGSRDSSLIRDYLAFNERTREWPIGDWVKAAQILCEDPKSDTVKQQTGYLVQLFVNRWDLTVEEAVRDVAMSVSFDGKYADDKRATCSALTSTDAGLVAPAEAWALADVYGCQSIGSNDNTWALWRAPKATSALVRLSLVKSCLHYDLEPEKVEGINGGWAMVSFLNCAPMFDQLDKAQILAELDRRKAPEWARVNALETLGDARRHIAVGEGLFTKMAAKDKDWKRLREVVTTRFADWSKEYAGYKTMFDNAYAIDEALASDSKAARASCDAEPLRAALVGMIGAAAPTTQDDFVAAVTTPVATMLALRVRDCLAARGARDEAAAWSWIVGKAPVDRGGTRSELRYAMIAALQELRADRSRALEGVNISYERGYDGAGGVSADEDRRVGKVGKVTASGDKVKVEFAPELIDVEVCTSWTETRRIDRIDSDGKIRYRQVCRATKKVKENIALGAITVPKRHAAGLATGTYVKMLRLGDQGVPLVVYGDKAGKKLLSVVGLELR